MTSRNCTFIFLLLNILGIAQSRTPDMLAKDFNMEHPGFVSSFEEKAMAVYKEYQLKGDFLFGLVNQDGLVYFLALNENVLKDQATGLDIDTPIYIASTTKSFTGTLLKILEQEGNLNLNDPVNKYLPDLTFKDSVDVSQISVKDLLNHTHGTFSAKLSWETAFVGYDGKNSTLINDMNTDFQLDPSHKFRYSNVGPIMAAVVAEEITHHSWKDLMKTRIFDKLSMEHTSCNVSDFQKDKIRPSLTVTGSGAVFNSGFYKEDITMHAAGGIISTVSDMAKWLQANINEDETLLKKESWTDLHQATTPQNRNFFTHAREGYSLGWDIAKYQGKTLLTRFGGLAGISFHCSFLPEEKLGIIAFSSDSRAYVYPHLMANYAYNLLSDTLEAEQIFKEEKTAFQKSFEEESQISYPLEEMQLLIDDVEQPLSGKYKNTAGWPDIVITAEQTGVFMRWGVLSGKIYKNEDGGYLADLGVLTRTFKVNGDTLSTGSLTYSKGTPD